MKICLGTALKSFVTANSRTLCLHYVHHTHNLHGHFWILLLLFQCVHSSCHMEELFLYLVVQRGQFAGSNRMHLLWTPLILFEGQKQIINTVRTVSSTSSLINMILSDTCLMHSVNSLRSQEHTHFTCTMIVAYSEEFVFEVFSSYKSC